MKRRIKRWIALVVLAATAFAQAAVSFADCPMQRGQLSQTLTRAAESPCASATHVKKDAPRYVNRCVAHCTQDLKAAGLPVAIAGGTAEAPVLLVRPARGAPAVNTGLDSPPPGTPPPRILLHAFLI
jgi:hypothetical protein